MSKTFDFEVGQWDDVVVNVPFEKPTGTLVAKFYVSQTVKSRGTELPGVVSWDSKGLVLSLNSGMTVPANFPARYTVTLSVNGGAEQEILTGRVRLNEYESGEVEIANDSGTALNVQLTNDSTGVGVTARVVNDRATLSVDGYPTAVFFFSGTFAGANFTFEISPDSTNGSDGNWYPTLASRIDTNSAVTATGALSAAAAYKTNVVGATWVRARLTAITSGTVNVWMVGSRLQSEPAPVIPTHAVTQSGTWSVLPLKTTTGGLTRYRLLTAATTNANVVKNSAGQVYTVHAFNGSAATKYLKFYNKATAPTVGTDVPVETYPLPAGAWTRISFEDLGNAFATGIGIAVTGAIADTDTTAVAANDCVINIHYA